MNLVGSDIVSLHCQWNKKSFSSKKYLNKFLNPDEFKVVEKYGFHPAVFWSCKESIYKVLLKIGYNYAFSPHLFHLNEIIQVEKNEFLKLNFAFDNQMFCCYSILNSDYVYSYTSLNFSENFDVENIILTNVTKFDDLIIMLEHKYPGIVIYKNHKNIPFVMYDSFSDISISNDDIYYLVTLLKKQ